MLDDITNQPQYRDNIIGYVIESSKAYPLFETPLPPIIEHPRIIQKILLRYSVKEEELIEKITESLEDNIYSAIGQLRPDDTIKVLSSIYDVKPVVLNCVQKIKDNRCYEFSKQYAKHEENMNKDLDIAITSQKWYCGLAKKLQHSPVQSKMYLKDSYKMEAEEEQLKKEISEHNLKIKTLLDSLNKFDDKISNLYKMIETILDANLSLPGCRKKLILDQDMEMCICHHLECDELMTYEDENAA